MKVVTLPAFANNYIFLLVGEAAPEVVVVDPGDAGPVLRHLQRSGQRLTAILNTHHHGDHVGGNLALLERFPGIPVIGRARDRGRIHNFRSAGHRVGFSWPVPRGEVGYQRAVHRSAPPK